VLRFSHSSEIAGESWKNRLFWKGLGTKRLIDVICTWQFWNFNINQLLFFIGQPWKLISDSWFNLLLRGTCRANGIMYHVPCSSHILVKNLRFLAVCFVLFVNGDPALRFYVLVLFDLTCWNFSQFYPSQMECTHLGNSFFWWCNTTAAFCWQIIKYLVTVLQPIYTDVDSPRCATHHKLQFFFFINLTSQPTTLYFTWPTLWYGWNAISWLWYQGRYSRLQSPL